MVSDKNNNSFNLKKMSQINYLNCIADQLTKVQHSENVYMVLISATLTTPWTIRMKHVSAHSAEKSETDTLTTSQTVAEKSETEVSHRTASTVQYKTRKTPNHRI